MFNSAKHDGKHRDMYSYMYSWFTVGKSRN